MFLALNHKIGTHLLEGLEAGALFLFDILELWRDFLEGEPKPEA